MYGDRLVGRLDLLSTASCLRSNFYHSRRTPEIPLCRHQIARVITQSRPGRACRSARQLPVPRILHCRICRRAPRGNHGRVEMWRGGGRFGLSVAASFVWRCPSTLAVTPFPHPAHRTGRADLPHPALGQDITPARVTPSADSEHSSEFDRLPNLRSRTTCCVGPELRSLPSTGITRSPRYYEPLRHPKAPGLSLAGVQLLGCPSTPRGFPCCARLPCVHAAATTPAQRLGSYSAQSPSRVNLPR